MNTHAFTPTGDREIAGVLLAGGQSRRFAEGEGDKCLQELDGKTLLERAALNAAPQVGALMLNINGDPERFPNMNLPIISDNIPGHAGPLAGVLSAMECVVNHAPQARWIATFATDTPFLPPNWVARVRAAITREGADMGTVSSNGRMHPVIGVWPTEMRYELRKAMVEQDMRKVDEWTGRFNVATVDFDVDDVDPFFNINTTEDLSQAANLI